MPPNSFFFQDSKGLFEKNQHRTKISLIFLLRIFEYSESIWNVDSNSDFTERTSMVYTNVNPFPHPSPMYYSIHPLLTLAFLKLLPSVLLAKTKKQKIIFIFKWLGLIKATEVLLLQQSSVKLWENTTNNMCKLSKMISLLRLTT